MRADAVYSCAENIGTRFVMEGTDFIFWNWEVALYLFVAGISAGAFAASGLTYLLGREKYRYVTRIGAYIAPLPLVVGLLALIHDLERPRLFWKLLVGFQIHSVMSWGAWLLAVFSLLSFFYCYLWLPDRFDAMEFLLNLIPRSWDKLAAVRALRTSGFFELLRRKSLNRLKGWVGGVGMTSSLLVGIYTGLLLGVVSARPFWNNPMLPMLFLVSALKTGTSSIGLIGFFFKGFDEANRKEIEANRVIIQVMDFTLMILSVIAVFLFVFGLYSSPRSALSAGLIMGGEFTLAFWGMVVAVGTLFPLALELYEIMSRPHGSASAPTHNPWIAGAVTLSVLVGGFVLRYVVVFAGQAAMIVSA